jgi:hypothetical protein
MMNVFRLTIAVFVASLLSACAKEVPPPITVGQFMADPILLEATVVRCAHDRSATKYDVECVNAREAGNRMASSDRDQRRKALEAQSARKRQALRRTQEAATEARRRATDAQRQREEDEYLGVYEVVPGDGSAPQDLDGGVVNTQPAQRADLLPGNQPGTTMSPKVEDVPGDSATAPATDIESVREELRRRQESTN